MLVRESVKSFVRRHVFRHLTMARGILGSIKTRRTRDLASPPQPGPPTCNLIMISMEASLVYAKVAKEGVDCDCGARIVMASPTRRALGMARIGGGAIMAVSGSAVMADVEAARRGGGSGGLYWCAGASPGGHIDADGGGARGGEAAVACSSFLSVSGRIHRPQSLS